MAEKCAKCPMREKCICIPSSDECFVRMQSFSIAIDEFAERLKEEYKQTITTSSSFVRESFEEVVDEIAEEMRGAE